MAMKKYEIAIRKKHFALKIWLSIALTLTTLAHAQQNNCDFSFGFIFPGDACLNYFRLLTGEDCQGRRYSFPEFGWCSPASASAIAQVGDPYGGFSFVRDDYIGLTGQFRVGFVGWCVRDNQVVPLRPAPDLPVGLLVSEDVEGGMDTHFGWSDIEASFQCRGESTSLGKWIKGANRSWYGSKHFSDVEIYYPFSSYTVDPNNEFIVWSTIYRTPPSLSAEAKLTCSQGGGFGSSSVWSRARCWWSAQIVNPMKYVLISSELGRTFRKGKDCERVPNAPEPADHAEGDTTVQLISRVTWANEYGDWFAYYLGSAVRYYRDLRGSWVCPYTEWFTPNGYAHDGWTHIWDSFLVEIGYPLGGGWKQPVEWYLGSEWVPIGQAPSFNLSQVPEEVWRQIISQFPYTYTVEVQVTDRCGDENSSDPFMRPGFKDKATYTMRLHLPIENIKEVYCSRNDCRDASNAYCQNCVQRPYVGLWPEREDQTCYPGMPGAVLIGRSGRNCTSRDATVTFTVQTEHSWTSSYRAGIMCQLGGDINMQDDMVKLTLKSTIGANLEETYSTSTVLRQGMTFQVTIPPQTYLEVWAVPSVIIRRFTADLYDRHGFVGQALFDVVQGVTSNIPTCLNVQIPGYQLCCIAVPTRCDR
jgi:hypothetical protein